jgi:hypothetical protein
MGNVQTNVDINGINTKQKHEFHVPNANCFINRKALTMQEPAYTAVFYLKLKSKTVIQKYLSHHSKTVS